MTALDHKAPDRVPFDLGGTGCTGIHRDTYVRLRDYLGLPKVDVRFDNPYGQVAHIDDDVLPRLNIDVRGVGAKAPSSYQEKRWEGEEYVYDKDMWGIVRRMPKEHRLYYDFYTHPLAGCSLEDVEKFPWPDMQDPAIVAGLQDDIDRLKAAGYPVVMGGLFAGPLWTLQSLQGYMDCYINLASKSNLPISEAIIDKALELERQFWDLCLDNLSTKPDVVFHGDDLAGLNGPVVSPAVIARLFKPYYRKVFSHIKRKAPDVKILFHICGAMRDFIPMLIEVGVNAINPVEVGAKGMGDTKQLKKDFGDDITFWGGGVDTKRILNRGTPQQVKDEVKRRIDDLAPSGGFVFAAVHNIEPDVPPENVMAMWEALQESGGY